MEHIDVSKLATMGAAICRRMSCCIDASCAVFEYGGGCDVFEYGG